MSDINILLIEDHTSARELLRVLLEAESYGVIEATDGRMGLDLARRKKPDLIIVDLMIPEINGERVVSEIRGDGELHSTPVIVVSAKAEALDGMRLVLGEENVFAKPFEPKLLLDRIGDLVGHPDD